MNPRAICILGGGGFIGSHLVSALLGAGWRVRAVDLDERRARAFFGRDGFEFRRFDVRDEGLLARAIEGCSTVAHLASLCNPSLYTTRTLATIESNFMQALPTVRLCRERRAHLVHFSTCEVYGRTLAGFAPADSPFAADPANYLLSEDAAPMLLGPLDRTRWSYACAKQLLERVIEAEGRENGPRFTIVRPFNFIGPGMDYLPGVDGDGLPRVMACFASALIRGESLPLVDGGRARRTFLYIDDAVDAVLRMVERPEAAAGRVFNVGNPANETDMAGLASLMIWAFTELTGRSFPPGTRDVPAAAFYGPGYEDCDRRVPDIRRAREILGWEPRTPLDEAVKRTLRAYLEAAGVRSREGRGDLHAGLQPGPAPRGDDRAGAGGGLGAGPRSLRRRRRQHRRDRGRRAAPCGVAARDPRAAVPAEPRLRRGRPGRACALRRGTGRGGDRPALRRAVRTGVAPRVAFRLRAARPRPRAGLAPRRRHGARGRHAGRQVGGGEGADRDRERGLPPAAHGLPQRHDPLLAAGAPHHPVRRAVGELRLRPRGDRLRAGRGALDRGGARSRRGTLARCRT